MNNNDKKEYTQEWSCIFFKKGEKSYSMNYAGNMKDALSKLKLDWGNVVIEKKSFDISDRNNFLKGNTVYSNIN